MYIQNQIIQIRVSKAFKDKLNKIARLRGLPLSTYVKVAVTEYLKGEKILENIEQDLDKEQYIEKLYKRINEERK